MVDKYKQNVQFFNRLAPRYDHFPLGWWLRRIQKKALNQLRPSPSSIILDIGCGTGAILEMLIHQGHKGKLLGVDISAVMLQKAKERLQNRAQLYKARAEKLPFPNQCIDIVVTTEAFHHFPHPKKAMIEMKRVIKDSGTICVSDLNFYVRLLHWIFQKIEPGCVHIYTKKEMHSLFVEAGLKNIQQKRIGLFVLMTVGYK